MDNYFIQYFKTNVKGMAEFRLNFLFDMISLLVVNSAFYGSVLYLAYTNNGFGDYSFKDITLGLSIMQLGYILGIGFFKGVFDMQENIISGTFDSLLIRPINSFAHMLFSRIDFKVIGEFPPLIILLFILNDISLLPFVLFFGICSAVIFNLSTCLVNCIPFFIEMNNDIESFDITANFSNYPPSIFNDFMKFLGLFIFPGLMISFGPVMILKDNSFAFVYFGFIAILIIAFIIVYNLGLKKYRSAGY
ncbi:MAG: ABC-2 family transporter protein [Candidatus Nanoarchaeia archaeon]|nr:ABC-2 family transporter protein [Candidatus Nanoarchaeia archaeon]